MRNSWLSLLALAAWAAVPTPAAAADRWALHVGAFDTAGEQVPELGIEYRFTPFKIKGVAFVPAVGAAVTEDENAWVYGGVRYDWRIAEHWLVTPHLGVSLYDAGNGKDLGGPIEFRSGLEVSYRFGRGSRVGILFYHLSNADLYGDDNNPGANTLALKWSF